mmetsp:Transcript_122513/g.346455  ORF Transcript_122513/g.346455 Transcript_122513/m.346455 type:complete len:209 (-) Transcript_122513:226-852(-)
MVCITVINEPTNKGFPPLFASSSAVSVKDSSDESSGASPHVPPSTSLCAANGSAAPAPDLVRETAVEAENLTSCSSSTCVAGPVASVPPSPAQKRLSSVKSVINSPKPRVSSSLCASNGSAAPAPDLVRETAVEAENLTSCSSSTCVAGPVASVPPSPAQKRLSSVKSVINSPRSEAVSAAAERLPAFIGSPRNGALSPPADRTSTFS